MSAIKRYRCPPTPVKRCLSYLERLARLGLHLRSRFGSASITTVPVKILEANPQRVYLCATFFYDYDIFWQITRGEEPVIDPAILQARLVYPHSPWILSLETHGTVIGLCHWLSTTWASPLPLAVRWQEVLYVG